jgi:hypothetical protein
MDHTLLVDPVTLEPLDCPVLASDGETYSLASLRAAMRADPWHRSPVTYEVLRPLAYHNRVVRRFMALADAGADAGAEAEGHAEDTGPVALFDAVGTAAPPAAMRTTWSLPELLSAEDTLLRRRFGLPDTALAVHVVMRKDDCGALWAMHPPPPEEMAADMVAFAHMLGLARVVQNPAALTTVTWTAADGAGSGTLEAAWMRASARATAASAQRPDCGRRVPTGAVHVGA